MSKIKIVGHASGTGVLTIAAPNTNTDRTITIPDVTGTLLDSGSDLPAANITGTLPANSIDSDNYVDGSIDTAHLANDVVSLAKMAHGTDGELITYDTSGAPAFVAVGSVGQVLTSAGAGQPPAFAAAAATVGGASGVDFNDSVKVRFGAGNDLELYSDGNSSFIKDNGSGEFYIRGTNIILKSGVDNDDYIKCNENSDVKIYYSNAEKLATTAAGVTVTGALSQTAPAAGTVLQVVSQTGTSRVSTTHTSWTEPSTNYRVSITPQFSNSMIVLNYHIVFNQQSSSNILTCLRAFRTISGGSKSYVLTSAGNSNGSRHVIAGGVIRPGNGFDTNDMNIEPIHAIDYPASTGVCVYGFESKPEGGNTTHWGYSGSSNSSWGWDADIVITAMEVKV